MKANESITKRSSLIPPEPVPRILITPSDSKKWKGCIYISSYDLSGQVLIYLKDLKRTSHGIFLKNPIFVCVASDKAEIESWISEKILSLNKSK